MKTGHKTSKITSVDNFQDEQKGLSRLAAPQLALRSGLVRKSIKLLHVSFRRSDGCAMLHRMRGKDSIIRFNISMDRVPSPWQYAHPLSRVLLHLVCAESRSNARV